MSQENITCYQEEIEELKQELNKTKYENSFLLKFVTSLLEEKVDKIEELTDLEKIKSTKLLELIEVLLKELRVEDAQELQSNKASHLE
jgi:hypothetical protein